MPPFNDDDDADDRHRPDDTDRVFDEFVLFAGKLDEITAAALRAGVDHQDLVGELLDRIAGVRQAERDEPLPYVLTAPRAAKP